MEEIAFQQTRALEETHWWFVGMRETYRMQIEGLGLGEGSRILDLGCGTGGNLDLLQGFGTTWGMDASFTAASFVKGRGWPRIAVGGATDLPFPDGVFDLVTALGVIEHVQRDDRMLEEMRRVTRPGGHMLIMTSAHPWLWSVHDDRVHHVRRYRRAELSDRVLAAGWRVEQNSYLNATLFPAVAVVRALQRLVPRRVTDTGGMSGFGLPPRPINRALGGLLGLEGSILRRRDLPMGVGLICRAVRGDDRPGPAARTTQGNGGR